MIMPRHPYWNWTMPGAWVKDAACNLEIADWFHPDLRLRHYRPHWNRAVEKARTVCHRCPVILQCREHGKNEHYGIWGGLAPEERGYHGVDAGKDDEIQVDA